MDGNRVRSRAPGETVPLLAQGAIAVAPGGEIAAVGTVGWDGGKGDWRAGLWARVVGIASAKHTLALIDQGVVSGTSFLTTILIARWCGAGELGVYSLGFSILVAWGCAQEALVSTPYTIYRHRPLLETEAEYAGCAMVHQGLLSALAIVTLALVATALSWSGAVQGLPAVIWILAGVIPFTMLREFGRRFAFAHLRMAQALALDLAVAVVQLAGLTWLASTGALSATTAYVALGAACALTGSVWLYLDSGNFVIRLGLVGRTLRQSWSLGKWLFAWQATLSVQAYFTYWLLASLLGTTATGVYAACMAVPLFSNPLILGISNILAPRAAQAYNQGGFVELRRVIFQTTLLLGMAMALFCVVVIVGGEAVMGLLYKGGQYEGHGHTVAVLALAMLATALGMPASNGLKIAERPDVVFKIAFVVVGVLVVLVPGLVIWWGLAGAAYGFLVGNVAGSVSRWVAFLVLVPRSGPKAGPMRMSSDPVEPTVVRVLQQFTQSARANDWVTEQVGEGVQANVYAIRSQNQQPIWQTHHCLVIKLYKPAAGPTIDRVRGQFASLSLLHAAVNDSTIQGWKTFIPAPLYVCESPLALVMTMVPGRELDWYLETGANVTPEFLESAPRAVAAAIKEFWSLGQLYGPLSFCNILCDIVARELSFVDVGLETDSFLCEGVAKHWYPASRDLAYMLYQTGVRVKSSIGNPRAYLRQQQFTEGVLRAFLETIDSVEDKQCLLDEIRACAGVHLRTLHMSCSPRGLWYMLLRQMAARRIDKLLTRLRNDTGIFSDKARF